MYFGQSESVTLFFVIRWLLVIECFVCSLCYLVTVSHQVISSFLKLVFITELGTGGKRIILIVVQNRSWDLTDLEEKGERVSPPPFYHTFFSKAIR